MPHRQERKLEPKQTGLGTLMHASRGQLGPSAAALKLGQCCCARQNHQRKAGTRKRAACAQTGLRAPGTLDVSDLDPALSRVEVADYRWADDGFQLCITLPLGEPVPREQVYCGILLGAT